MSAYMYRGIVETHLSAQIWSGSLSLYVRSWWKLMVTSDVTQLVEMSRLAFMFVFFSHSVERLIELLALLRVQPTGYGICGV